MLTRTTNIEGGTMHDAGREYAVVAVCDSVLLTKLQGEMRRYLGLRPTTEFITHNVDTSPAITRVKFEFNAAQSDDRGLVDVVRHLCTLPGVRYVRLHSHV